MSVCEGVLVECVRCVGGVGEVCEGVLVEWVKCVRVCWWSGWV